MNKKYKINKRISFSVVILSFCFFVLSMPSFANDKKVEEKIDNNTSCNTEYLKLLEAVKIKVDVANEKENAYNKAINELKLYASFFGTLLVAIVIFLGIWRNNKIVDTKDEIMKDIENKKKNLGEENAINVDKKMLDLDKNKNITIQEIKKEVKGDIDDIRSRLEKIENGKDNTNITDEIKEYNNELLKDENPYD